MSKSAEAFRTISEVSDYLETPAHVLRFWESRFTQIRPVKRAGGRRYYRPADMALLSGIKKLLHDDGLTIRGVQKILKEQGVRHVADLGGLPFTDDDTGSAADAGTAFAAGEIAADDAAARLAAAAATGDLFAAVRQTPRADVSPGAAMRAAMSRSSGPPTAEAPEAPMDVDVPTLPADRAGTVHSFAGVADRPAPDTGGPERRQEDAPADSPGGAAPASARPVSATDERQPAAAMLRAMDALRARDKRSELKSVYLRLSDLRDRLARSGPLRPGD